MHNGMRDFAVADDEKKCSWYTYHNPYYNPEKCRLEILEVTEKPNLGYAFEMVVLWRDIETGKKYWASDAGCSCPSPFEDVKGLADLSTDLTQYEEVKRECAKPSEW